MSAEKDKRKSHVLRSVSECSSAEIIMTGGKHQLGSKREHRERSLSKDWIEMKQNRQIENRKNPVRKTVKLSSLYKKK